MGSARRTITVAVGSLAFGAGVAAGAAWPRPAAAGLSVGDPATGAAFGPYSYSDSLCTRPVDPVNVLFLGDWSTVQTHAADHGGWGVNGGDSQNFWDHGRCQPMNQASASNGVAQPRFHMRYRTGSLDAAGRTFDVDPYWGMYTGATVHHEDLVVDANCKNVFGHAVDDQSETGGSGIFAWEGGFNRGRADILKNWWSNGGGHIAESLTQNWGNNGPRVQCNGNVAWSDGVVYYIQARGANDAPTPTAVPTATNTLTPGGGGGGSGGGGVGGGGKIF